jgi:predicted RNA-binding Zn-ribbon protein involved in translation (DUF1610 family)
MNIFSNEEKDVCQECGYIGKDFPEMTRKNGLIFWTVKETVKRCPECGSLEVRDLASCLEEIVSDKIRYE